MILRSVTMYKYVLFGTVCGRREHGRAPDAAGLIAPNSRIYACTLLAAASIFGPFFRKDNKR